MTLRVATAALSRRIFAGHLNKAQIGFKEPRTDVTSDCLRAVVDHIGVGKETILREDGVPLYRITITDLGALSKPVEAAAECPCFFASDCEPAICPHKPSKPEGAADWQPIETAPADQRSILGINANSKIALVTWRASDKAKVGRMAAFDYAIPHSANLWKPTHWMPLPAPPALSPSTPEAR